MARGVVEGTNRVPGVVTTLKKVSEVSKEDLDAADGIILGCPTYFANVPGEMKTTIDDWNWKMKVDFTDKVGGAFATAGGQVGGQEHVVVSCFYLCCTTGWWWLGRSIETKKQAASGQSRVPLQLRGRSTRAWAKESLTVPGDSASAWPVWQQR